MAYMDSYYVLSLNILKALGGDTSIIYPDADAIWDEINKIYNNAGNRFDIVPLEKNITENGQYDYYPDGDADAFMPVNINVNVPQKYTDEQVFEIESNAIQQGYNQGYVEGEAEGKLTGREEGYTDGYNTGYGTGVTDGGNAQKAKLVDITITENGVYTKDDGYKTVTVEIEAGIPEEELQQMLQEAMDEGYRDGYAEGVDDGREDGIAEQKEKLESTTFRDNGTYTKEDGWNEVTVQVDVPTFETETLSVELKSNGNYNYTPTTDGYSSVSVTVDVDTSGGGKPKILNGFIINGTKYDDRRPSTNLSYLDFSQYDWSGVYDLSYFFGNYYNSTSSVRWLNTDFNSFAEHFNGQILACENMFYPSSGNRGLLSHVPSNLSNKFNNCLSFKKLFENNRNFTDTSGLSNSNTSNVISTNSMFNGCSELSKVTLFDTSNVVDMSKMFYGCGYLTSVPEFDTSNVCNMTAMFYSCTSLTSVPEFDMSNVIDIKQMFANCNSLKIIPNMNTSKLRNFTGNTTDSGPFSNTTKIEKIGTIDCSSIQNFNYLFRANMTALTDFGGCINLGKMANITATNTQYSLYYAPNLNYESVLNIVNGLYDRASAGYPIVTLKLHPNHLAKLSDEDKAIATNKGWTLS